MRALRSFVILALLVLPSLAVAQRGGGMGGIGGMGGRGGGGGMGGGRRGNAGNMDREPAKFPAATELQKFNPAELLLDKRKKLSLSDAQVTELTKVRQSIYDRSAPVLAGYDSVQRAYKPTKHDPREAQSAWTDSLAKLEGAQLRFLRAKIDTLTNWRREDVTLSLDLIVEEKQKLAAAGLIDKQEEEFLKALPSAEDPRGAVGRGRRP